MFGNVIEGMDVVDAIAAVDVRPRRAFEKVYEAVPLDPVVIHSAVIEETNEGSNQ